MIERASVSYTPQEYPPTYLQALGYKCGCGNFFNNTCRAEFREVRRAWTMPCVRVRASLRASLRALSDCLSA